MARERLPNRRIAETFELEVNGLRYTVTIGRHDGRVLEVFLQNHKPGSQSDANARDAAVAASLALQFGCPLEMLQRALLRDWYPLSGASRFRGSGHAPERERPRAASNTVEAKGSDTKSGYPTTARPASGCAS
jgi:ribonucleoside-diphosphate reductase alpha chain